ncbi:MAG: hypothetical protein RL318_1285 [Fibrobacterota bacterium]|jgi:signal transduction histidine kinase/CheY-like chemotaxis protein
MPLDRTIAAAWGDAVKLPSAPVGLAGKVLHSILVSLACMLVAVLVRRFPLHGLEGRIIWVTFYPAVVAAGVLGGWSSALVTTLASCLVAVHAWPFFHTRPFIRDGGDWLGLWAFVFNCVLIGAMAWMMRRSRDRAELARCDAEKQREAALAANQAKSTFLANMSHELRTPLNAILGFSQILGNDPAATASQKEKLHTILGAGEHLLAIINDILDLSKIESGKVVAEPRAFDLGEMLQDIVMMLRGRAHAKGLELELDQSSSFPRFVLADSAKLRQVLINLVGNAIKFTNEGRVVIKLSLNGQRTENGLRRMCFEVSDTGPGIAAQDHARIFDPFVQLGTQEGTGLGLAITRQFVAVLGGSISMQSALGEGTKFVFTACYEPAEVTALDPGLRGQGRIISVEGANRLRVLVVDDSPENRAVARGFLEPLGFAIREAANGHEGVQVFRDWKPHLVLLDRRMPVLDGIGAAREMRQLEPVGERSAILAVTAHAYRDEQEQMLEAGCDAFLAKPYSEADLLGAMVRLLRLEIHREVPTGVESAKLGVLEASLLDGVQDADLDELAELLDRSDMMGIEGKIHALSKAHPELSRHLFHHTERFEYGMLSKWIRTVRTGRNS